MTHCLSAVSRPFFMDAHGCTAEGFHVVVISSEHLSFPLEFPCHFQPSLYQLQCNFSIHSIVSQDKFLETLEAAEHRKEGRTLIRTWSLERYLVAKAGRIPGEAVGFYQTFGTPHLENTHLDAEGVSKPNLEKIFLSPLSWSGASCSISLRFKGKKPQWKRLRHLRMYLKHIPSQLMVTEILAPDMVDKYPIFYRISHPSTVWQGLSSWISQLTIQLWWVVLNFSSSKKSRHRILFN